MSNRLSETSADKYIVNLVMIFAIWGRPRCLVYLFLWKLKVPVMTRQPDQRFSLKQWFAGGAQSRGLRNLVVVIVN